jgi:nitrite reductase/ring-hydroxylating ferredoxin subunit
MKLLKMIFGICETGEPGDGGCWSYQGGQITVGMKRAQEVMTPGGAIRLEGKGLPGRILLFHGLDGKFYAVRNRCSHIGGRRIDPSSERDRLKCCSVMGSVFNYKGDVVSGPARKPLTSYPVIAEQGKLIINLATGGA